MNQANRKAADALEDNRRWRVNNVGGAAFCFRCELAARIAAGGCLNDSSFNVTKDGAAGLAEWSLQVADAIIAAASKGD